MQAPGPSPVAKQQLRIGIAGYGTAGRSLVPAIRKHGLCQWVALADPEATHREELAREPDLTVYTSLQDMLGHPGLDAVYIATPTTLHVQHVLLAVGAGKHVLVEKPMAIDVAHALPMVQAAEDAGLVFVVGHSHGFDLPVLRMREIIASGRLGPVRMMNTSCYTDWMHRPRRADERDASQGGGVTYRQGAHQFDILRLLGGGLVRSLRAKTFAWSEDKAGIGAHMVFMDFEDGAAATAVYNGYGGFSSAEVCDGISETGFHQMPEYRARGAPDAGPNQDVQRAKAERAKQANWSAAPYQPVFGQTIVSCERGDMRQSPKGLLLYENGARTEIELPLDQSPRDLVLAEFYDAITGKRAAQHDARWGLANLELCDAAIASSKSGAEIRLAHQVALRS